MTGQCLVKGRPWWGITSTGVEADPVSRCKAAAVIIEQLKMMSVGDLDQEPPRDMLKNKWEHDGRAEGLTPASSMLYG